MFSLAGTYVFETVQQAHDVPFRSYFEYLAGFCVCIKMYIMVIYWYVTSVYCSI
ncbi:hypothetical protein HanPI659440_Chr06g0248481 [Helianthus annuus]|nr:hypothetical protein HanPI659440_Chr06g0248481 [Helianthus annuus]